MFAAKVFSGLMKNSYLCIVRSEMEICGEGSQKLFSGLTKFAACPERKKLKPYGRQRVNQP